MSNPDNKRPPVANIPPALRAGMFKVVAAEMPTFTEKLKIDAEQMMRKRLDIPVGQPTPRSLLTVISDEVARSVADSVSSLAQSDIHGLVQSRVKGPAFALFNDKIKAAATSAQIMGSSAEVASILKQKAELMFAKKKAYEAAGFTAEESMKILLQEIAAK
jgi:hypothetical protein